MTTKQPMGLLTLELVRIGVFRGKLMEDQREVDDTFEVDVYEVQDIGDMFFAFASEHGYDDLPNPRLTRLPNDTIQGGLVLKQETNEWTILSVKVVPPEPVLSEEEQEIERIEQEEALATTRIFRVWRKRLDTFKSAQAELPANPKDRTPVEQEKWLQLKGAIDVTSSFLTDLQRVRPQNESALG